MTIEIWVYLYLAIGISSCMSIIYFTIFIEDIVNTDKLMVVALFSILIWPLYLLFGLLYISFLSIKKYDKEIQVQDDELCDERNNKLKENKNELKFISELQQNWDGYDALPISCGVLNDAYNIINHLLIQPNTILPTAAGTIQLEWNGENGAYLEFNILGNGIVRYLQISPNSIMDIKSNKDYAKFVKKYTDQDTIDSEEYDRMNEIISDFSGAVYRKVIFDTTDKE